MRIAPFKLGLVVRDTNNAPWVYVGWRITSVGSRSHYFIKASEGTYCAGYPWAYTAVTKETLVKKFPDIEPHISEETDADE